MADSVRKVLEDMLPELEDLQAKKLFSPDEVKSIIKQRTDFEYKLHSRVKHKVDFLRYIEYELNVEYLRSRRRARLGVLKKRSLSEYSGVRRIHFVFSRALRVYKGDIALWNKYFDFCIATGGLKRTGRVFARALQLHPLNAAFWRRAAEWESEVNQNARAGRTLLQRALRLLRTDVSLWTAYFRLEATYLHKVILRRFLIGSNDHSLIERYLPNWLQTTRTTTTSNPTTDPTTDPTTATSSSSCSGLGNVELVPITTNTNTTTAPPLSDDESRDASLAMFLAGKVLRVAFQSAIDALHPKPTPPDNPTRTTNTIITKSHPHQQKTTSSPSPSSSPLSSVTPWGYTTASMIALTLGSVTPLLQFVAAGEDPTLTFAHTAVHLVRVLIDRINEPETKTNDSLRAGEIIPAESVARVADFLLRVPAVGGEGSMRRALHGSVVGDGSTVEGEVEESSPALKLWWSGFFGFWERMLKRAVRGVSGSAVVDEDLITAMFRRFMDHYHLKSGLGESSPLHDHIHRFVSLMTPEKRFSPTLLGHYLETLYSCGLHSIGESVLTRALKRYPDSPTLLAYRSYGLASSASCQTVADARRIGQSLLSDLTRSSVMGGMGGVSGSEDTAGGGSMVNPITVQTVLNLSVARPNCLTGDEILTTLQSVIPRSPEPIPLVDAVLCWMQTTGHWDERFVDWTLQSFRVPWSLYEKILAWESLALLTHPIAATTHPKKRLHTIYEIGARLYGATNSDFWIRFCEFDTQTNASATTTLYARALRSLADPAPFTERYAQLHGTHTLGF